MRSPTRILYVSGASLALILALVVGIEFEGLALSVRAKGNDGAETAAPIEARVPPGRIEGLFTGDVPDEFLVCLYPFRESLGLASQFVPREGPAVAITRASRGAFAFENLAPGRYGIRPDPASNRLYPFSSTDACRWVTVESGCTARSLEELRLMSGCLVSGTVVSAAGTPVANAHVFAIESAIADDLTWLTSLEYLVSRRCRSDDATWIETISRRAHHVTADSLGHYELRALVRDSYRVFAATDDGSISAKQSIQVTRNTSTTDFVVEPGGFVRGLARSHSALAIRRVGEHDPREILESSDNGQFAFLPIAEGDAVIESLGDDTGMRTGPALRLARVHVARNSTSTLDLRETGFPVTVTVLSGGLPMTEGTVLFRGMRKTPDDTGRITLFSEYEGNRDVSFEFVLDDVTHHLACEVAIVPGTPCTTAIEIGSFNLAITAVDTNGAMKRARLTALTCERPAPYHGGPSEWHAVECSDHVVDSDTSHRIRCLPFGRYVATVQFENGAIGQAAILLEHDDVLYVREGQHAPSDF